VMLVNEARDLNASDPSDTGPDTLP
jgi:hypothetical protein